MSDLAACGKTNAAAKLLKFQKQLMPIRLAAWLATVVAIVALAFLVASVVRHWSDMAFPHKAGDWFSVFFAIFWSLGLPLIIYLCGLLTGSRVHLNPTDERSIGKYTESQIRTLVRECATGLPPQFASATVRITKDRGTQASTFLSLLWPGWPGRPVICISSGALHYLSPEELKGVILHEMAHHIPGARISVPGSWFVVSTALLLFSWLVGSSLGEGIGALCYFIPYLLIVYCVRAVSDTASRQVEHACDLYAASRLGPAPIANVVLKTGEEAELTEAVLARVSARLPQKSTTDWDDLAVAFEQTRPHGRLFHENLFRHAREVYDEVLPEKLRRKTKPLGKNRDSKEFQQYIDERRSRMRRRIRWRTFDSDGDGTLSSEELLKLGSILRARPMLNLVVSEDEAHPTTHPSHRQRLLLLADCLTHGE
jgi:Zn-dependent protease with chaperone function